MARDSGLPKKRAAKGGTTTRRRKSAKKKVPKKKVKRRKSSASAKPTTVQALEANLISISMLLQSAAVNKDWDGHMVAKVIDSSTNAIERLTLCIERLQPKCSTAITEPNKRSANRNGSGPVNPKDLFNSRRK